MLVATAVAMLGFLAVAFGTRRYGLRLWGTIVIGVLAVYTLKNFSTLPIFVGSAVIAYVTLWYTKNSTLIYGRDEFVVAILAGSVVPALVYLGAFLLPGAVQVEVYQSIFIGSLLSGITAFNYHQLQAKFRRKDLLFGTGIYLGLLMLGAVLVSPQTRFLAEYTPLVLFAKTSDIAVLRGAVVEGYVDPAFVARPFVIGLFALTLGLSELARREFGLRVGTVALGLVAIHTVFSWRLLALFLIATAIVALLNTLIHRSVILYGRALLSISAALGVVLAVLLANVLGVASGLSALFGGILAGFYGYNIHMAPPRERRQLAAVSVAIFPPLVLLVRASVAPGADGLPQSFGLLHVLIGSVIALLALAVALHLRIEQPRNEDVLSASVLMRGESNE